MTTPRQISAQAITTATRTIRAAYDAVCEQEYTDGVDNTDEISRLDGLLETLAAADPTTLGDIVSDLSGTGATVEDYDAL
jgi:hypothetical protein